MLRTENWMFKLYKSSKLIMLVVYMIIIIMKHFYSYFTKHLPTNRAAMFPVWSAQRTSDTETLHVCDQVAMETLSQNQCTAALGSVPPLFSVNQQLSFQSGGLMSFNVSRWFSHRSNTTFTQWSSEESTVCLLCERWASVLVVYYMCGMFVQTCCINCRLQFNMSQ